MLTVKYLTTTALLLVVTSSASATPNVPRANAEARNISMWTDDTYQTTMIKFLNVPNAYDLSDVKHADFAGMFWTFANGETWLTLNSKRLWLTPDYNDNLERSSDAVDDWLVMGPEELHEALAAFPLYEDLLGDFETVLARNKATEAEPGQLESRATCRTARCYTSGDCYRYSTTVLNCYRCNNHHCTVMHLQPNFIGSGPNPH